MRSKEVVMFMERSCPICFRLGQMLFEFCTLRGLRFTEVEVDAGMDSLLGRYWFFVEQVFGGEKNVPVVLVGNERWYVPRRTTRAGREERGLTKQVIDEACARVVEEIERDLDRRERDYPPTHAQMRLGARTWLPST
jgi:glutaredoxin